MNQFKERSSSKTLRVYGQAFVAYATQSGSGLFCPLIVALVLVTSARAEPARVAVLDFSLSDTAGTTERWERDSAARKFKPAADK